MKKYLCIIPVFFLVFSGWSQTIWRIGLENGDNTEFTGSENPSSYTVRADWQSRTDWSSWSGRTSGATSINGEKWNSAITYTLDQVPSGGAEFVLKTIESNGMVPEIAVFSNRMLCGILQIIGADTPNESNPRRFGTTYKVYIPAQLLQQGDNTLRLEKLAPTYNRGTNNRIYLFVAWDYFRLDGLADIPDEPVHSRTVYLGCVYGSNGFRVDDTRCNTEWKIWEWLGIAYSGNPVRAQFWSNLPSSLQPNRTEYLQVCKDYAMTVVLDRLTDKDSETNESDYLTAGGELATAKKDVLDNAFSAWGDLVQYYEISNEPCMGITKGSFEVNKTIARYVTENAPSHWQTTAPGYTYGGGWGKPVDWDADDAMRIELEQFCEATAGHSYGNSYYKTDGILAQTIDTYGNGSPKVIENGFPKEVVLTECGTHHTSHKDYTNLGIGNEAGGKVRASMFDKNIRAHIGYADRILNFAMWDRDAPFRLIGGSRGDTTTWCEHVYPTNSTFPNAEIQNKLQIFRRLACAYATHGAPLAYSYLNASQLEDRLAYFRAVNTAGNAPLPGSNATANKVLINFVNFHHAQSCTMRVQVTMPWSGTWDGVRFGPEPCYTDARATVSVAAEPTVAFEEEIGPLEAVQYILTPPSDITRTHSAAHQPGGVNTLQSAAGMKPVVFVKNNHLIIDHKAQRPGFHLVLYTLHGTAVVKQELNSRRTRVDLSTIGTQPFMLHIRSKAGMLIESSMLLHYK
ncbi:MAG: hypothetical protein GF398_15180 [Chitinivibrionales bacterium]|nr:hypothetical protein [Chitinivibrionales bacterium]